MSPVHQRLNHFAIQTRRDDVDANLEKVSAVGAQVNFGVGG